jgi:hypothetical protein
MLHDKAYNEALTQDLRIAYLQRDCNFLLEEVKYLCAAIASNPQYDEGTEKYNQVATRLFLCLAFVDSLKRGGNTVKLVCDIVNF